MASNIISAQDVLQAILRRHLPSYLRYAFWHLEKGRKYVPNWHIEAICFMLNEVRLGRITRLLIALPPRSLKSLTASVVFPSFLHGLDPTKRFICVSYSQELSSKLHNDYRSVLRSPWYQDLFPGTRIDLRKDTEVETLLTAKGGRLATSTGGTLTGRGGDILIIDEPMRAADGASATKREDVFSWYASTLRSRLDDPQNGAIIVIAQRLHVDDLLGRLIDGNDRWNILQLPVIAQCDERVQIADKKFHLFKKGQILHPGRYTHEGLAVNREEIGPYNFSAQYLQEPVAPEGNLFRREWVKRYHGMPEREPGDEVIVAWDTASKDGLANDWSVATVWLRKGGLHYLIDVIRQRMEYPTLRRKALALAMTYKPRMVIVEDAGVGTAMITELRRAGIGTFAASTIGSKEARASVQTAKFEGGLVLFPDKAPWLAELETELFAFPNGRYDDQVDSIVHALAYDRPRPKTTVSTYIS